ncbi:MAG: hypothetical protein IPL06_02405 [Betaproteobacteria bacterium]|nr:hypothetical protein [Betaproteobacteria bacterium]
MSDGIYHISGDVVGYSAFAIPKNRGAFVNVGPIIEEGLRKYRDECLSGTYPLAENTIHMQADEAERLKTLLAGRYGNGAT